MYLHFSVTSFLLLSAGALALPSGTDSFSIPAHDIQADAPTETHSVLIKRSQRAELAQYDNYKCAGAPVVNYEQENFLHGEFLGHCFQIDAAKYSINVIWGSKEPAESLGRTGGICFFHDDKCKDIGAGQAALGDATMCVNMAYEMEMRPLIDKRPWKSAKFWHGAYPNKPPCDMKDTGLGGWGG